MYSPCHSCPLLLLSALLLSRPAVAAWPESPYANVPVSAASARQGNPRAIPDGSGGAFIVWEDSRGSSTDIYAQRMSSSGVPLWTVNGVAVCTAIDAQTLPVLASDGAGGIVIAWQDQRASATTGADIWAQRLNGGGLAQWAAKGVSVITFANTQGQPHIATGPLGGAIVVWSDLAGVGGGYDIYGLTASILDYDDLPLVLGLMCYAARRQTDLCSVPPTVWPNGRRSF